MNVHSDTLPQLPVGKWVIRTAESVVLICCPPAPLARYVSIFRSSVRISTSTSSEISGTTSQDTNEVWRLPEESKRRNTHQPVYSFFGLQIAIDIVSFDNKRNTLDPRFVTRLNNPGFNLEAAFLRPAGIHAQQHLPPVLGLGSACTGMQLQNGIELVIRLIEQQLQLEFIDLAANSESFQPPASSSSPSSSASSSVASIFS